MITLILGVTENGKTEPVTYVRGSRDKQNSKSQELLKDLNTGAKKIGKKKYKHYKPVVVLSSDEVRS